MSSFILSPPQLVAVAKDTYLKPKIPFPDNTHLWGYDIPKYGQDISYGYDRSAPGNYNVGNDPQELKSKMRKLLNTFASNDKFGMAKRLFDAFLADTCREITYFDDPALNLAAEYHPNINYFCNATLSVPNVIHKAVGKTRIHQALKNVNWDIKKLPLLHGLGVPAFNHGSKVFTTKDFDNGLGLMINGVQYAYVVATHYRFDSNEMRYFITLKFLFYDVFGLDDDDLAEYGALSDSVFSSEAAIGISAWWQLQHQHGYAPLVTRIVLERSYAVPAI